MRVLLQHFGTPTEVLTDRGSAFFKSKEFEEFCEVEGIQKRVITTGVPRGNGQVERINDVVNNTLKKIAANDNQSGTGTSVKCRAINFTHQRSIGTSPYRLLFGVDPRVPGALETAQLVEREVL